MNQNFMKTMLLMSACTAFGLAYSPQAMAASPKPAINAVQQGKKVSGHIADSEGPVVGAAVGLIFGVFSVIQSITAPTPVSFVFMNPLVSVLPRVLIGIIPYYVYRSLRMKKKIIPIGIASAVGSLMNTIGVLGMIYIIYLGSYAKALNISSSAAQKGIIAVGITNGIPEMILCILITISVVTAVTKIKHK